MSTYIRKIKVDKYDRFQIREICGDCLAKIGVKNRGGGFAIIDFWGKPKVGDIVYCLRHNQNIGAYIKQVKRIEGDSIIVGTAYLDESKDFEFEAGELLGVVIETYAKGHKCREYVRPTHLRKKDFRRSANDG